MEKNKKEAAAKLQSEIVSLMDAMTAFKKKYPKFELPEESNEYRIAKELLTKGEFNLAVCGKVKNGKSSLINSLIGRELLPVCNDVATSRVFKISKAEDDKFYVVYSNGDKKEISKEELSLYGSQAVINQQGEQDVNQSIAYIQVFTKIDFLPDGVSLLDTPGIGSTYPQHTEITKRYMQMADAAIFVMNPTPLEDIEVDFLKEVIGITHGLLFVTTKIDLNGIDSVEASMKRNKEIIEKAVGEKLPFGVTMLKMSSKQLMDAAQEKDSSIAEFNYCVSGYEDVKEAITNMVFTILGYYRVGIAYNACVEHYRDVLGVIKLRLETVKKATTNYEEQNAKYEKASANFKEKMGDARLKEINAEIEARLKAMEGEFNQIFSSDGEIYTKYSDEINVLQSGEIKEYGDKLGDRIIADIQQKWNELTALVQNKIEEILVNLDKECSMSLPEGTIYINTKMEDDPDLKGVPARDRIMKMRNEMFLGTAMTGALTTLVGGAYYFLPAMVTPALPVIAPIVVVLGVGSVLWGAISGNQKAKEESLVKNKKELLNYLAKTMKQCRKQLVEVSIADNKYKSLYQGFQSAVREQATNTINRIYEEYSKELEKMKEAVKEAKQNPQMVMGLEHLVKEWSGNKEAILHIQQQLEVLKSEK